MLLVVSAYLTHIMKVKNALSCTNGWPKTVSVIALHATSDKIELYGAVSPHLASLAPDFDTVNFTIVAINRALQGAYPSLEQWWKTRERSPKRVVFGPGQSYVGWQPMGDHLLGKEAPTTVKELINSAHTWYTSIRLVALGVQDAYIIIWENGTMRWDLKDQYAALDDILSKFDGEDVSVRASFLKCSPRSCKCWNPEAYTYIQSSSSPLMRTAPATISSISTRTN